MKYKVGDKVKVRSDLNYEKYSDGVPFTSEMDKFKGTVLEVRKIAGGFYEMIGIPYIFTDEMLEPVEEMSAEEAIKLSEKMCSSSACYECPVFKSRKKYGEMCNVFKKEHAEEYLEILKQWKADHEKKPIETEFIWYLLVVEEKTHIVKYEKPIKIERERTTDEQKEELLREWCSEHDGKYYVTTERRCVVKE